MNRTLYLQVLDYDRFSRDDPIGEICLPLTEVDLAQGQTLWRTLQPCKGHTVSVTLCVKPYKITIYSGTCLNRPAMGAATYGLFIQVVSLCKFEILESVFNRSIRLYVL